MRCDDLRAIIGSAVAMSDKSDGIVSQFTQAQGKTTRYRPGESGINFAQIGHWPCDVIFIEAFDMRSRLL